jgi:hypothetical protein
MHGEGGGGTHVGRCQDVPQLACYASLVDVEWIIRKLAPRRLMAARARKSSAESTQRDV